ncbi:MAG: glycosyl hydrolase, partial [Candidatus Omnitrophica bacterium]|nr:glycosyl hydrolase [Candidatus Omnitrophota bacterium]
MKKFTYFFIFLIIILFIFPTSFSDEPQKNIQIKSVSTCIFGYSLYVDGKPFFVKGVIYNPTPIGKGYDYDFYSDPNKPWLVDGKLMKEAGINCVRVYSVSKDLEKTRQFIQDMYNEFGIYTIVSDWLGLWDEEGPNYADENFCKKQKERILKVVEALKDEKGLLMWVLGNENDYTFSGSREIGFWTSQEIEKLEPTLKSRKRAEIYYKFVDELAGEIKKIDPVHPVALGCGEINYLRIASQVCNNIDIIAIIFYRGKNFANVFESIRNFFDKPMLVSEFGCDSYDAFRQKEDEDVQAEYILAQWEDIYRNSLCSGNPKGNCIGGTIFEWTDEWWKHNEGYRSDWSIHNTEAGWSQGAYTFDNRAK